MADYIPNTRLQQQELLAELGLNTPEDLFRDIPQAVRLDRSLELPPALSEIELSSHMKRLSSQNANVEELCCFLGAGSYDHYVPAAVKSLLARQEFYTAYTPYQPEISQGTLQAIFEYQTMICKLTGMDQANASMYDGATAMAEAALMASLATRKNKILVSGAVNTEYRDVLATYARYVEQSVGLLDWDRQNGGTDLAVLSGQVTDDTAAVIVQYPDFFGVIDDLARIAAIVHEKNALLIVCCDPISLSLLRSPGDAGADIVVGEGQGLGNSMSFGGPGLGFLAARQSLLRRMPGRIVGQTTDANGRICYVLTLQTREQHIRREKATSNICSNEALNALAATIYLALNGKQGMVAIAEQCVQKAHYLYDRLLQMPQFRPAFNRPFFKEFAVSFSGDLAALNRFLHQKSMLGGLEVATAYPELPGIWLLAVTEKRTKADMDRLLTLVHEFVDSEGK